jgi:hypothetical protein
MDVGDESIDAVKQFVSSHANLVQHCSALHAEVTPCRATEA